MLKHLPFWSKITRQAPTRTKNIAPIEISGIKLLFMITDQNKLANKTSTRSQARSVLFTSLNTQPNVIDHSRFKDKFVLNFTSNESSYLLSVVYGVMSWFDNLQIFKSY